MADEIDRVQRAIDSVFRHRGIAAEYRPSGGGVAVPCLIIKDSGDQNIDFGQGRPLSQGNTVDVRKNELANPARDGVFVTADEQFKVLASPRSDDPHRLIWTFTVG